VPLDGGHRSAPEAIQIADRWQLWHNLGEAVERAVARHRQCLRSGHCAAPGQRSDRIAARTRQRHAAIHQLLAGDCSVRAIAADLGLARNTARRFARTSDPEELGCCQQWHRPPRQHS
jgi:hypothetical protein